ncbi:DinB family protein [Acidicapsa acidisoli]|uniref:DinB family protein n=1 Tax=Acidicapsa acidisoli TaxID=1615681 RepID=UPI0021E0F126|nr:DinB family protein [Acidicapsa acidisoli]
MTSFRVFPSSSSRRSFLTGVTGLAAGISGMSLLTASAHAAAPDSASANDFSVIGPRPGYSPQIGTLVSMLTWVDHGVTGPVKGLTQPQLDTLFDANANTIGALLLHLAAAETFYQIHTFEGKPYGEVPDSVKKQFGAALELGDKGRKEIKEHDLDYYLNIMKETREKTLAGFKKRDDNWLMTIDPKFFGDAPTNNYCKWFHVCEHESHHAGQIAFLVKRLPGAKPASD